MPKKSRIKARLLQICGGVLIAGGFLLFMANQIGLFHIFPFIDVLTIIVGIILQQAGKSRAPRATIASQRIYPPPTTQRVKVSAPLKPAQEVNVPHQSARPRPLAPPTQPQPSRSNIVGLRINLLVKCLHNEGQVDRLIAFERRLNPGASEERLLQAAIDRWERDNR